MSLRSARPVDDSLSELAEQMALDEPSAARDNGETSEQVHSHTGMQNHLSRQHHTGMCNTYTCYILYDVNWIYMLHVNTVSQSIREEKVLKKGCKAACVAIMMKSNYVTSTTLLGVTQ